MESAIQGSELVEFGIQRPLGLPRIGRYGFRYISSEILSGSMGIVFSEVLNKQTSKIHKLKRYVKLILTQN
jgi:hypothetical protein